MSNLSIPEYRITVDQLRPGVFIRLQRTNWFDHPFLFNSFKIKNQEQIDIIMGLGITEVICIPEKSDRLPGRPTAPLASAAPELAAEPETSPEVTRLWELKRERIERLRDKRRRIAECEEVYAHSIRDAEKITKGVISGREDAVLEAMAFVDTLVDHFLLDQESTLHLMNVLGTEEPVYSHPLNVTILSMILGRAAGLDAPGMRTLGMGALFHDIGQSRLEKKLLRKRGQLTKPEQDLMRRHPEYGLDILKAVPGFPQQSLPIVIQHHEQFDGGGYPAGLKGEAIDRLARIVTVADAYDRHCNRPDPADSLTPYLALSFMFSQEKARYDRSLLQMFIRCLGVYPPGTVVQLSNGTIGMVLAVHPENQLNPSLVLYDPDIPRTEALVVDLAEEDDLHVEKSIRLAHLPPEIFEYLNPRTRISYSVQAS